MNHLCPVGKLQKELSPNYIEIHILYLKLQGKL